MKKKNCLNNYDRVFITVALWAAMLAVFAVGLTLPMLPKEVTIFYLSSENAKPFSKYNNLVICLLPAFVCAIIIVAALLRRYGRMQHNFPSIMLFCIMLSVCYGVVSIYGISKQFDSTNSIRNININSIVALALCLFASVTASLIPFILQSPKYKAHSVRRSLRRTYVFFELENYWDVAMSVFLCAGILSAFIPHWLSFLPVLISAIGCTVFYEVRGYINMKRGMENVLYDSIEN